MHVSGQGALALCIKTNVLGLGALAIRIETRLSCRSADAICIKTFDQVYFFPAYQSLTHD